MGRFLYPASEEFRNLVPESQAIGPKKSCLFPVTLPYKKKFKKIPTLKFFRPHNQRKLHIFDQKNNLPTYLPYFFDDHYMKQTISFLDLVNVTLWHVCIKSWVISIPCSNPLIVRYKCLASFQTYTVFANYTINLSTIKRFNPP